MNKQELISTVAKKTGQTKEAVSVTLDAILESIKDSLVNNQDVRLKGFGRFYARRYKAREITAPTQETVYVNEHRLPCFKAGKAFKDALERS